MGSKHGAENEKKIQLNSKKIMLAGIVALIVVIIIVAYEVFNKASDDELKGTWTTDGVTVYEFDGKGKGAMKLPADEYKFSYILHNNDIYIDFESEDATDSDYEYSFEGDNLVLKGIKATTGTYTFTRNG